MPMHYIYKQANAHANSNDRGLIIYKQFNMYCCHCSALFLKGQIGLLPSRVIAIARNGIFILLLESVVLGPQASYYDRSAGKDVDRSCLYMIRHVRICRQVGS